MLCFRRLEDLRKKAYPNHYEIQRVKHDETTGQRRAAHEDLLDELSQCEFLFITGKGGVGKSCVAGVVALEAARRGRRVLIVYPGNSEPGSDLWDRPVQSHAQEVSQNVFAVSVNSEDSMRQYTGEILGSTKLAAVLFHHRVARGLLTEIPGPSEWAILGRAWAYTKTGATDRGRGEKAYDLVIVDAPSSGDGSGMLRMPQVVIDLAPAAALRKDAESCLRMLRDERKSRVVFVTLAEELSITETEENMEVVRQQLKMPLGPIFVNQVVPAAFSPSDCDAILNIRKAHIAPEVAPADGHDPSPQERTEICLDIAQRTAARQRLQARYLTRVSEWGLSTLELSRLPGDLVGKSGLQKLQMTLAASRPDGYRPDL